MLNSIKYAIFDMDGTLVDSLFLWDVIWENLGVKFLHSKGFRPSQADDKAVRTMTLQDAMCYINKAYSIGKDGEELLCETNKLLEDFYEGKVQLKEGVLEFLEYCYSKNIKMCIASATESALIKAAVKHCELCKYFECIISCADVGKGKDEPDIYIRALECLGGTPEQACIFEDSLVAINTANNMGMKTVGIFDKYNYGHDEMKKLSTVYIGEGESLKKLVC